MAKYDYKCKDCGDITERSKSVKSDDYKNSIQCYLCGGEAEWQYPISSFNLVVVGSPYVGGSPAQVKGYPYHDEGLGCDISGPRERNQVMKSLGVTEAGDKVSGARKFEEGNAVGKSELKGVSHSDNQRSHERGRIAKENALIHAQLAGGGEKTMRHGDQKFDKKKSIGYKIS
jgi:hypothetical protein